MRSAALILWVCGLAALGYWTFVTVRAHRYQQEQIRRFTPKNGAAETSVESPAGPQPGNPAPVPRPEIGSPVALLEIPRLALSAVVVEGAGHDELDLGPGHVLQTPLPGEGGNIGVAGHRDSVFRPLRLIREGDSIRVIYNHREYAYRVTSIEIVDPKDVRVLFPTERETLTLITCYPFYYVGAAPRRYIVHAVRTDLAEAAKQPSAMSPQ